MRKTFSNAVLAASVTILGSLAAPATANAGEDIAALDAGQLVELSFDELLNIEITSVSKKAERLRDAPAAIHVISAADLRRSGARSIPDALRMVPGVQVAQIDANKWAVSARGFNGRFANRLLVLIDGRSVYSPVYSGVYWEQQDTFLEDIERIEVIRGPGATLWGANAVNGVINIITSNAADTQGTRIYAGTGNNNHAFGGARQGFTFGEQGYGRAYIKYKRLGDSDLVAGGSARDDWDNLQAGFRSDLELDSTQRVTLQGDIYRQQIDKFVSLASLAPPYSTITQDDAKAHGGNLLGRWTRDLADDEQLQVQAYVDHYARDELFVQQTIDTFDIELQHRFKPAPAHELVWGLGYRYYDVDADATASIGFTGNTLDRQTFSAFVQDEITLSPERWKLILGSKFEHNDATGFEVQPSARLVFKPEARQSFWAAISRAVRTPSIGEQEGIVRSLVLPPGAPPYFAGVPVQFLLNGEQYDESETQISYEAGWRFEASSNLSIDSAIYYNEYENGRTAVAGAFIPGNPATQVLNLVNDVYGKAYGLELAVDWRLNDSTHMQLAYSHQRAFDDGTLAQNPNGNEGSLPHNQLSLRTDIQLTPSIEANIWLRHVDELESITPLSGLPVTIPSYTEADLQITWQARPGLELSLVGRNLLDAEHEEFVQEAFTLPTNVERSVYGYVKVDF